MSAKQKRPPALPGSEHREMELIGLDEDGRMSLWDTGMVQPVTSFEAIDGGRSIKSGHYVIEWKGHAITVHCGNYANGTVSVLFMCSRGGGISMARADVETILLGKVIPDPVAEARELALLKKAAEMIYRFQVSDPDRHRGHIQTGPKD